MMPPLHAVLLAMLIAALLSAAAIAAIFPLLRRYALARPNARSSHRVPTPQGAGIAVIGATLGTAAGLAALQHEDLSGALPALIAATLLLMAVGAIDDLRPIPVPPRLILQMIAVGLVIAALPQGMRLLPALPLAVERTLLLLSALWLVNLVNFMDGIDWMTVAEFVPVTAALLLLSRLGALSPLPTMVAAALCGSMLGFAPFNRPVARVFLGDVGSLPAGLLLGWCLLDVAANGNIAAAVLLPLYYIADSTITLLRRLGKGEKVWVAHRSHFYQRATDNGFSVMRVVGTVFALNCVLAGLATLCVMVSAHAIQAAALAFGIAAVWLVLARFSRRIESA